MTQLIAASLVLGMVFLTVAVLAIWRGIVLSTIWGWFMVPVFGLPALTITPAIGVALVVSFLTYQYSASDAAQDTNNYNTAMAGLLYPLVVLIIGFFVHRFM